MRFNGFRKTISSEEFNCWLNELLDLSELVTEQDRALNAVRCIARIVIQNKAAAPSYASKIKGILMTTYDEKPFPHHFAITYLKSNYENRLVSYSVTSIELVRTLMDEFLIEVLAKYDEKYKDNFVDFEEFDCLLSLWKKTAPKNDNNQSTYLN